MDLDWDKERELERLKLYDEALKSVDTWKDNLLSTYRGLSNTGTGTLNLSGSLSKGRNEIERQQRSYLGSVTLQRGIESLASRDLSHLGKEVSAIIKNKAREVKLYNNLAHFSLNNSIEFQKFCKDTLNNDLNKSHFSKDFIIRLDYFHRVSDNFTNTLLSFYMQNKDILDYVIKTSNLTRGFNGSTSLKAVRTTKAFTLTGSTVIATQETDHIVIKIDYKKVIDDILIRMFQFEGGLNPFRIQVGGLIYFRDLVGAFKTYANFETILLNQLTENVLNNLNCLYIGSREDTVYFSINETYLNETKIDFRVYGVDFSLNIDTVPVRKG